MAKSFREILGIIFRPRKGRMSRDIDKRYLAEGDFIDSLNTRSTTTSGGSTGDRESVIGNTLAFTLPQVGVQNKTFRIYLNATTATLRTLTFFDGNGVQIGLAATWTSTLNNLASTYTDATVVAVTSISARLTAAVQTFTIGSLVTTGTDVGYFDFSIDTYTGWDYSLTLVSTFADIPPLVIAEAIDFSMTGNMQCIGSFDLTGELYVWSTTQKNLPSVINVLGATGGGTAGSVRITVADTSVFSSNLVLVVVANVGGVAEADGNWIISIVDGTHIDLQGSVFTTGPYTSGGTITINSLGLGEVGHAVRDINTNVWTYVTLIRSRVFNFRTKKQPKTYCEKSSTLKSLYWTDDYNVPRVLYDRTVNYQNNCLLTFVDPLNTYDYSTLATESRLILSDTDLALLFTGQAQSGGAILSGNWGYAVRLETESNTFTDWTFLSKPIPATVDSELGSGWAFLGRNSGIATPKINNFLVTGNILGIFKKIQLAAVNYLNGGFTGTIIRSVDVSPNSIILTHTGQETDTQDLDVGTLAAFSQVYTRAKNIDSLAQSLILSNLETTAEVDLSDFFANLPYSIERRLVTESTGSAINGSLTVGEYQLSDNVYELAGHMLNERYRYGFTVEWRSGGISSVFYGVDAVFDRNAATNKTVNIPDYNICLSTGAPPSSAQAYTFFIRFTINPNTVINGQKLKDFVKKINVMRCPVDSPQVLACGICIPAINGHAGNATINMGWGPIPYSIAANVNYGEFPFVAGYSNDFPTAGIAVNYAFPDDGGSSTVNFAIQNNYGSFYFPDLFMGNASITPNIGLDKILNFGQPKVAKAPYTDTFGHDYLIEAYDGLLATAPPALTITEAVFLDAVSVGVINGVTYSKLLLFDNNGAAGSHGFGAPGGFVMYFSGTTLVKVTANSNLYPCYYVQYYRPIANANDQYGEILDSKYIWTGATFDCDGSATTVDVFGGDTVAQKCWYKDRYPDTTILGFGQGFGWYNQCRINFQMRTNNSATIPTFPTLPVVGAVQRWLSNTNLEPLVYNKGYNLSTNSLNSLQLLPAFNPDPDANNNDYPVRIAYSNNKIPESAQDSYRIFLPLNFKDLDYKNGEIMHHAIANGELVTWQVLMLMKQYFDPTGMLKTSSGDEIILGDAAKLQRRGATVTTYGTKNGFSILKGKTQGGNDAYYWIDTLNRAVFRMVLYADGTVNLGLVHGMDSFFETHLQFVEGIDTPADGQGICSTWNERNKEAIFTVRGYNTSLSEWLASVYDYSDIFDFTNVANGKEPHGNLIQTGGLLYGLTNQGGANGLGVFFKFDPVAFTTTDLHDFGGVNDGTLPYGTPFYASNNRFYGLTSNGGTNALGVIWEYNPGSSTYTKLFNLTLAGGGNPFGNLVESGAGIFYGLTSQGGANLLGSIIRYNINTSTFTNLHSFTTSEGSGSQSSFLKIGTVLYGMTFAGGTNGFGTIFKWDIGGGTYTKLHDFDGTNGQNPTGSLFRASDGKLYGTTTLGGANNKGVLFQFNLTGNVYTKKYDFGRIVGLTNEDGETPSGSVIEPITGFIFGTCKEGGVSLVGSLWMWDIVNDLFVNIHSALPGNGVSTGSAYTGDLLLYNGFLYGLATAGGAGHGCIFTEEVTLHIYNTGDAVTYLTSDYEGFPDIYVSLIDGNNSQLPTFPNSTAWEKADRTNGDYYNLYTIAFNEITNGFDLFYSFLPKIYLPFKNTYLSPKPIDIESEVYEHGRGNYSQWYVTQIVDGYYTFVINDTPTNIKRFLALMFRTNVVPERVDITTSLGMKTFMIASDFDFKEGNWRSAIQNDTVAGGGLPNTDSGKLVGDFCEIKLTFATGTYQRFYEAMCRVKMRSRNAQS